MNLATLDQGAEASRQILELAERIERGSILITFPNGESHLISAPISGPAAIMNLHSPVAAHRLRLQGGKGLCESYIEGEWSTPDLNTFFRLIQRNEDMLNLDLRGVFESAGFAFRATAGGGMDEKHRRIWELHFALAETVLQNRVPEMIE